MERQEHDKTIIKTSSSGVSYAWVAALLASALGGLILLFVTTSLESQKSINDAQQANTQQNQQAITALEAEAVKQTALIVIIAEKVGVPTVEVDTLLNSSVPQQ
jgi:hypothetical protein